MIPACFSSKDGVFRKYQGARTKDDFLSFIHEKKWKAVEPVSSWFGPSSFLWVSILSHCLMLKLYQPELLDGYDNHIFNLCSLFRLEFVMVTHGSWFTLPPFNHSSNNNESLLYLKKQKMTWGFFSLWCFKVRHKHTPSRATHVIFVCWLCSNVGDWNC